MTDQEDTWLSQWFDDEGNEFERRRSTDRAKAEPESLKKLSSYQLVRDTLANQLPDQVAPDFAEQVMAKVSLEDKPTKMTGNNKYPAWFRPVAGIAIAASVAAMAIFISPTGNTPTDVDSTPTLVAASSLKQPMNGAATFNARTVNANFGAQPAFQISSLVPQGEMMSIAGPDYNRQWKHLDPSMKEALGRYIMDHHVGQFEQPVPNVLPSVRLIGFSEVQ